MYRQGTPPPRDFESRCLYCGRRPSPFGDACACGAPLPPSSFEEPVGPLPCPRCRTLELGDAPADSHGWARHCHVCGGLFVGARAWSELLSMGSPQELGHLDEGLGASLGPAQLFPLASCPQCRREMERATFGARSGVTVDVCNVHGIWFDAGELARVLHWLTEPATPPGEKDALVALGLRVRDGPRSLASASANDLYAAFTSAGDRLRLRRT